MLRKLVVFSKDKTFCDRLKAMSLMLTKLNYFIDLNIVQTAKDELIDKDSFYIITDVDSEEGLLAIKKIRTSNELKNNKIIAVHSKKFIKTKEEIFKAECDVVIEKEEFLKVFDSIIK